MKIVKLVVCLVVLVAALVYAAKPGIPTDKASAMGLQFKAVKETLTFKATNGWIFVTGGSEKTTLQLDKSSATPNGQSILIDNAKALKASLKSPGSFSNIIFGTISGSNPFVNVGPSIVVTNNPTNIVTITKTALDLASVKFTAPSKSIGLQLKGVTVGTVIAKKCAPKVDGMQNLLLTEIKAGKGVVITAGAQGLGAASGTNTLGLALSMTNLIRDADFLTQARNAKISSKGAIANLYIWSQSLAEKKVGKPVSSIKASAITGSHALKPVSGKVDSSYKEKPAGLKYDLGETSTNATSSNAVVVVSN